MIRRARWLRSLWTQIILWAALAIAITIVGLALLAVYAHERDMEAFVSDRDQAAVTLLARRLEDALESGALSTEVSLGGSRLGVGDWLATADPGLHGEVWIVDHSGGVLARGGAGTRTPLSLDPARLGIWDVEEGNVRARDPSAGTLIVAFATVRPNGWRVAMIEPLDDVLSPILRLSGLGPIAATLGVFLSILLLVLGWRTIVQPLRRLSRAASAVSWGGTDAVYQEYPGAVTEIEDLQNALVAMVNRLDGCQAGLFDYLGAITKGQEEERARLARELHDGPVQSMIALAQRVELAQHRIERGDCDGAVALLDTLRTAEVGIIEDLRRTIGALRPAYLDDLGFVPALEQLVETESTRYPHSGARVRLEVNGTVQRLRPELELAAYRIVQEALSNALQHAFADLITVFVRWEQSTLAIEVRDNGVGFSPAARPDTYTNENHYGLVGLQERVRQVGGSLTIDAGPGRGTLVSVRLPTARYLPDS